MDAGKRSRKFPLLLLLTLFLIPIFVWSAITPKDRLTWWLEAIPVVIGLPLLWASHKRFPITALLLSLLFVHAVILLVGAHYTYAEVPLFDYLKDIFGFQRNHYDRLGHFAQGFVPAILLREIFVRRDIINSRNWLAVLTVSCCLAFSALYELIEWWSALLLGQGAEAFLGTQGDPWDTQSDMCLALIGASCALLLLTRFHDRQINKLTSV